MKIKGVNKVKRIFVLAGIMGILLSALNFSYAQEQEDAEGILVLREAKEYRKTTVAAQVYLIDDILEVTVIARMYAEKPRFYKVSIVGPKLGRLSPKTREELTSMMEEETPYPTTKKGIFISFGKKTKTKKARGTLIRELFQFKIPRDKIVPGKHYQLRVAVESKTRGGGMPVKFKFDLQDLPEFLQSRSLNYN